MNTCDSHLAHGTEGSPQFWLENLEYAQKTAQLENAILAIDRSDLTDAQKGRLKKLEYTISQHLREEDLSGALKDLQGHPVTNKAGKKFDHRKEVKDAYASLEKISSALKGSLRNPNLSTEHRQILQHSLNRAEEYIRQIEDLFKPFGGI